MKIADNTVVAFHYELTDDDGQVLDTSEGQEPMSYLHGADNIIPGLEAAMAGHEAGDRFSVSIAPEEAYGPPEEHLVQTVPHEAFEGVEKVEPGMRFEARDEEGNSRAVEVVEVGDEGVTVDGNHPLAGRTLHFQIEIAEVREATDEEIAHGHSHTGDHAHDH